MSKKHFIALAKALRASRFSMEGYAFMLLVNDVADVCAAASTTFNRSTFISHVLED